MLPWLHAFASDRHHQIKFIRNLQHIVIIGRFILAVMFLQALLQNQVNIARALDQLNQFTELGRD